MSDEEQLLEETIELLKSFKDSLLPCIWSAKKLLQRLTDNELSTESGLSVYDLKNQMFLGYLMDLAQLIKNKLSGEKIDGNGTLERLVEERVVLEKIRPIEDKLKYQVDTLMKVLSTGQIDHNDPMNLKPSFSFIDANENDAESDDNDEIGDEEEDEETEERKTQSTERKSKSDVYVPPRLAQMKFEDMEEKKNRALEHAKKRAMNSSIIRELRREFDDAPEEEHDSILHQKSGIGKYLKQKKRFEEDNFIRLNLTKKQKAQARKLTTVQSVADDIIRFEDISALDANNSNHFKVSKKRKNSKKPMKKKGFSKRRKH